MSPAAIHARAIELGKLAVEMTTAAGSGHPSSALSLAHIVTMLMYRQMRWDPADPTNPAADRLVLSEGHAVPIIYAALADRGAAATWPDGTTRPLTRDDVRSLRAIDSPLDGHPNPRVGVHFFDAATGSLGQGLSVAAGLAAAAQIDGLDRNIYCIIGDGESREGQIWEACDFIVDHCLTHVVPIFNCNQLAQSDWVSPQQSYETLAAKLKAFGFIVRSIDGHDPRQIISALDELPVVQNGARPLALVARTVKGWGSPLLQGMGHHGSPVKKEKLARVLEELDRTAAELGASADPIKVLPPPARPSSAPASAATIMSFDEAMAAVGLKMDKPMATRKAYGAALVALGHSNSRVVALDADVKNSTYAEWFADRFPQRFLECRIAEQNMLSAAVGLAAAGKIPFCSTFAKFYQRAYDQLDMAVIGAANIKLTGSHAGVTLAADGPSQMALPDLAFFRAYAHVDAPHPAVRLFFPSDAVSCFHCTLLMAELEGCCYQRTLRADLPLLYKPQERFEPGGFKVLREGKDATLIASGYMVHECLKAADELAGSGRSATVVDAYSLPLNTSPLLEVIRRTNGRILTVEDNYAGGLEAEIAAAIATSGESFRFTPLYVRNIPKSGREPDDLLEYVHLSRRHILAAI